MNNNQRNETMKKIRIICAALLLSLIPARTLAQKYEMPKNVIKMSGGLSFITSKMYIEDEVTGNIRKSSWKSGTSALLEYEHMLGGKWGFGMNFIYNDTRYPRNSNYNSKTTQALRQIYIGPSIVRRSIVGNRWCFEGAFGLGFCHVGGDLLDKCLGVGIMLKGGVEYMFSKHVGIGAELNDVLTFFGSNNTEYLRKIDPNDRSFISGTSRIEIATGIRFYF